MAIDVVKACQQCLGEEAEILESALVYLDEGAAEAFHFVGGLPFFLQLGVRSLCDLENAASSDAQINWTLKESPLLKIVIVTSQLLNDAHRYILRCLRLYPKLQHCFIYCSISEDAHSGCPDTPLGMDAFSEYRDLLLQDLCAVDTREELTGSNDEVEAFSKLNVTVKHLPLLCCSLTPKVFALPSKSKVAAAPLANRKERSFLSQGFPAYDDGASWEDDELVSSAAALHAHFLYQLAAQLELKFDVFSLGRVSHIVGKQFTDISARTSDGTGRARRTASLLLLDRSLDLITPSWHSDSLIDRIYAHLPRQASNSASTLSGENQKKEASVRRPSLVVRIPTSEGGDVKHVVQERDIVLTADSTGQEAVSGSLSTSWDFQGAERLDALFEKKSKDGAIFLRKCLQDALRLEKIELPGKSRLAVSPSELRSLVISLLENPRSALKHTGLAQLGKAAAEVLGSAQASKWEALASAEKVLSISAADGVDNLALQAMDLIKQSSSQDAQHSSSLVSLRDALTVLIVAYGLAGDYTVNQGTPFSWEQERSLKEAVVDAVLKGPAPTSLGFLKGLDSALESHWLKSHARAKDVPQDDDWSEEQWENWDESEEMGQQEFTELQLKLELNDRVEELFAVLRKVAAARTHYPMKTISLGHGAFRGLISEVLSLVLSKVDVPGLKHHSSTVGRLLKSGLGRFGLRGQAAPQLSDHKILIVFIVGGFNAAEAREARALQGDFEEILIGGTTLLTADDMYNLLLNSCEF